MPRPGPLAALVRFALGAAAVATPADPIRFGVVEGSVRDAAIPMVLDGRVSVAADWWTDGTWRLGAALWPRPHRGVALWFGLP
ncbi:MAG TPA: hypothetical protein VM734_13100 [Kofleriaceae bacterium]|nr:hypothetical protein [Kofleriaceae bacterium]